MPIFEYRALTTAGKPRKGIIDADTARDARGKLRHEHVHVTEMWEVETRDRTEKAGPKPSGLKIEFKLKLKRRINTRDLAAFTRQFSTLLKSGIQLAEALKALVEQTTDRGL